MHYFKNEKVSAIKSLQMNQTCAIGGDAKKNVIFYVSKDVLVDRMLKEQLVEEEKEVSVLGWESYEQFRRTFKMAAEQGKMTQDRCEMILEACKNVCLGTM